MKAIIRISFVAAALASFMYAETSLAQNNVIVESDRVEYQKKTVIDFSKIDIEGIRTAPDMGRVTGKKRVKFDVLIGLRSNFRPELQRSLDNM